MIYNIEAGVVNCKECVQDFCFQKCEGFEVTNLLPKREFDEDDPMADEFRKAEVQFLKMQSKGTRTMFEIKSIDVVKNKKLRENFEAKKAELARSSGTNVKSLLLFHGTPQRNIDSIIRNNFDLSIRANGRALGDGVYFSEQPEVSVGYSFPCEWCNIMHRLTEYVVTSHR